MAATEQLFCPCWSREREPFLASFTPATGQGAEQVGGAILPDALFDTHFADPERYRDLVAITAVDEDVFVACAEHAAADFAPDCCAQPTTHLFLLTFADERLSIIPIRSASSWAMGQVTH